MNAKAFGQKQNNFFKNAAFAIGAPISVPLMTAEVCLLKRNQSKVCSGTVDFFIEAKDYYKNDIDQKKEETEQQQRNLEAKRRELEEINAERTVVQCIQHRIDRVTSKIEKMVWIREYHGALFGILSEEQTLNKSTKESPPPAKREREEPMTLEMMMKNVYRPVAVEFFQQRDLIQEEFVNIVSCEHSGTLYRDIGVFFNDCVASVRKLGASYPILVPLLEQNIMGETVVLPEIMTKSDLFFRDLTKCDPR